MDNMSQSLWPLKDKNGKPPANDDVVWKVIKNLDRKKLFPCSRTVDELEMEKQEKAPREMNSFMLFRRHLAYIVKQANSHDGKILSRLASFIWNGADKTEKGAYTQMALELKRRHYEKYPNYTYERRRRKTEEEDFINLDPEALGKQIKRIRVKTPVNPGFTSREKQECVAPPTMLTPTAPTPTAPVIASIQESQLSQEGGNGEVWINSLPTSQECLENNGPLEFDINNLAYDFYSSTLETPVFSNIDDYNLPLVANAVLSANYIASDAQAIIHQNNQILPILQHGYPSFIDTQYHNVVVGDLDAGIGLQTPYEVLLNNYNHQYG